MMPPIIFLPIVELAAINLFTADQKDKIIRIQNEEYTQLLHYCSY